MNGIEFPDDIKTCIIEHLEILSAELRSYFNKNTLHVSWLRDPLNTKISPNAEEAEELAEFKVSNAMKLAFNNKTDDSSFWLSLYDTYPLLSKKASVIFVKFPTTYQWCSRDHMIRDRDRDRKIFSRPRPRSRPENFET